MDGWWSSNTQRVSEIARETMREGDGFGYIKSWT